jgi:hypothetical protein
MLNPYEVLLFSFLLPRLKPGAIDILLLRSNEYNFKNLIYSVFISHFK